MQMHFGVFDEVFDEGSRDKIRQYRIHAFRHAKNGQSFSKKA